MTQVTGTGPASTAASTLTDGTGVSKLLGSKVVKDFVLDALLSMPVSLAVINIGDLHAATAAPVAVAFAIGDGLIRVAYRAALRWAQSS
jgi:ABC-type antimicrobial peptide transport system permease subunit